MNDWKEKIAFKGDKILWYIVIMLMIASVMVVYSSTGRLAYNEKAGNTFFYLIKQLFLIGGCFGVMFIVQSIHYRYFYKYAGVLLFVSMILLVCAAFGGTNINGAGRWIRLPLIDQVRVWIINHLQLIVMNHDVVSKRKEAVKKLTERNVTPMFNTYKGPLLSTSIPPM